MNDRLTHLLTRLRERFPLDTDVAEVEAFLSSEGLNRREIVEIVSAWISESVEPDSIMDSEASSIAFRVPGPHERGRFTPEAWGHLLSLFGSGIVSPMEVEGVIDRALAQLEGRIALDDLRTLIESGGMEEFGPSPDHVTIH